MRGVVLALMAAAASAAPWNSQLASPTKVEGSVRAPPVPTYNQTTEWYDGQTLDHFNMQDARTYSQRFFVIDNFWKAPSGPVILHICGEYVSAQSRLPRAQG